MAKSEKVTVEILLVSAKLTDGGFQKILRRSRNLLTIDLIWPPVPSCSSSAPARDCRLAAFVCGHNS